MHVPPRETKPAVDEDLVSAIALGRTIAFLFYSFGTVILTMIIAEIYVHPRLPRAEWDSADWIVFGSLEGLLLPLVAYGLLPATAGDKAAPFSERSAEWGIAVMSFVPWLFHTNEKWFAVYMWAINGTLLLVAGVYFVTKSILSRYPRIEVLRILVFPIAHLLIGRWVDA